MPTDLRLKENLKRINKSLERFQRKVGQTVLWYSFATSTPEVAEDEYLEDLYDEGSSVNPGVGRSYNPPRRCPVIQAYYGGDAQNFDTEGTYLVDRLHLTISVAQWKKHVRLPLVTPDHHVFDRLVYDGLTYDVEHFELMGRVAEQYTIIRVQAIQVKDDEGFLDDTSIVRPTPLPEPAVPPADSTNTVIDGGTP